jgi:hypothetical protein
MPFSNDDWKKVQTIIAAQTQSLQSILVAKQTEELARGLTLTKREWVLQRLSRVAFVQKMFEDEIRKAAKNIIKTAREGVAQAVNVSSKEVVQVVGNEAAQEIKRVKGVSLLIGSGKVQERVQTAMQALFQTAVQDYRATINRVNVDSRGLFEALSSAVESKSDNGYIAYADGRNVSFNAYMEMSIRTDLQQNALFNLEESAKAVGLQAYVASAHFDSADDHEEFQGYYYLADNVPWKDEYQQYGFHPKYHYLSEVKALGFLTRPNCRHYVQPVALDDILAGKDLHKTLGVLNEKARPGAYEDLERQRTIERNIRKYKDRANNAKVMMENAPKEAKAEAAQAFKQANAKTREWQAAMRDLEKNTDIRRQYKREKPGVVIQNAKAVPKP